jgi:UDP-N-acetylmuramoyl-tripeptide--D-alanyl-D-alanine ligase
MSLRFQTSDVVRWTGGRRIHGPAGGWLEGASIDTRTLRSGQLFVAIRGPNHDAHRFLSQALKAGAAGLVVARGSRVPEGCPSTVGIVEVEDTTAALGAVAAGHRASFEGPVVAITGSNGKTTTKEMCASILNQSSPCLKNPGNWNNQFGVPLTLLQRSEAHRSIVVEIGMNHRGEIAPLAAIARPNVGVITNIGTAHIEHLGSRQAIALEKGDLIEGLPGNGTAVLNADDPNALDQRRRTEAQVVTFGRSDKADVRAERLTALGARGFVFDLTTPGGRSPVHVAGLGETTVMNALAAAAAAVAAGASLEQVGSGLASFRPVDGRMEQLTLPRNIIVINDTYNANPQSMEVALRSLADLKGSSRAVAVLGDMGELGASAVAAHRAAGRLVADLGIELLFALGEHAEDVAAGAIDAGMERERVHVGRDHAEAGASLRTLLHGNDWVLVKGSRSMRMERVVEALASGAEAP